MLSSSKRLARRRLDGKLLSLDPLRQLPPPSKGWLRAIRDALGMSGAQFARRLGVSWQTMDDMERSEARGTIGLDTLRKGAEALDCTLFYVLIPNRSLEDAVQQRARRTAASIIDRADQTMALEDQRVAGRREELIDDYVRDHVKDRDVWENK